VAASPHRLVIVESPAKAKTIAGFLGQGWTVESSYGHVRDLPTGAKDVPAAKKARFSDPVGVDVEGGFEPLYRVSPDARSRIKKLKGALAGADELYLATDEDREGESIAWHLQQELKPSVPVRRMVFHEITRQAIEQAVQETRDINVHLVQAQETRRIVDRLYGYPVTEVVWRKVKPGLSAGRVQSVATRLLVDRERERIAFRAASYWDLQASLAPLDAATPVTAEAFEARLVALDGVRVATGRDFDASAALTSTGVRVLDEATAVAVAAALADRAVVRSVEAKPYRRSPYAPFRTTTLQQEASRKLGWTASRTMSVAQRLYEGGYITYMRTDSTTLAQAALTAARAQVRALYGEDYLADAPRIYRNKVKNAQEAHEAVRPAGESFRTPAETGLAGEEFRLYELVWMRTVASQMRDAVGQSVAVTVHADLAGPQAPAATATFSASGRVITFPGFLKAYVEGRDSDDEQTDASERRLPEVVEGQPLAVLAATPDGHQTKPPPRYTEASMVRVLEEREIGRPSTYASIIRTILDRGYAWKKGSALVPTWLAFAVTRLLEEHFTALVDYDFTARLEDELDRIAAGELDRLEVLTEFWCGDADFPGVHPLVTALPEIDARRLSTFALSGGTEHGGLDVRVGRFGTYVEDGEGRRADVPDDLTPDELSADLARELIAARESGERLLGTDPVTGRRVELKVGRYGPFVSEVLEADAPKKAKPRRAGLLAGMDPATLTLAEALALLDLPRVVGTLDDQEVLASNGRYGPYLRKGTETRSLPADVSPLTVTIEQARDLFAQPKAGRGGRGQGTGRPAGRPLGPDPATGEQVAVRSGRFGPYVSDGKVNATIPKSEDPDAITLERAAELLAAKRAT